MHKMISIVYEDLALSRIESFLMFIKTNDRFNDTGIYSEKILKENFIQRGYDLINELLESIEYILLDGNLGRIVEEKTAEVEKSKIYIGIRSYKIFVKCRFVIKENTYYIENITINT